MPKSNNLFRPPFHLPTDCIEECKEMAIICDKFFSLCRTIEIQMDDSVLKKGAMLCKDHEGWYIFGRPNRFPLSSVEINVCEEPLTDELNKFIDKIDIDNKAWCNNFHNIKLKSPHSIFGKDVLIIHLGVIKDRSPILPEPFFAVAVFPFNKVDQAEYKIEKLLESVYSDQRCYPNLTIHRLDVLGKIADEIVPRDYKKEFNLNETLDQIADLVSKLIGTSICSIFLKESVENIIPPDFKHEGNEKLKLVAAKGYSIDGESMLEHELVDYNRESPPGITVSILQDRLQNSKQRGKIIILNHRIEVGGYDLELPQEKKDARDDLKKVLNDEKKSLPLKLFEKYSDEIYFTFGYVRNVLKRRENDQWWRGVLNQKRKSIAPCSGLIGLPIYVHGEPVGCIKIEGANDSDETRKNSFEGNRFTFQNMVLLDCIARLLAVVIHTANDLVRMKYDLRVSSKNSKILSRSAIADPFSEEGVGDHDLRVWPVIFIDLDNFKSINEQLSYEWGDRALKILAKTLNECVEKYMYEATEEAKKRVIEKALEDKNKSAGPELLNQGSEDVADENSDFLDNEYRKAIAEIPEASVARWGGDEFVIVFSKDVSLETVNKICNYIKHNLPLKIIKKESPVRMYASFGFAKESSLHKAVRNASNANKIAKYSGKNQLVIYEKIKTLLAEVGKENIRRDPPLQIIEVLSDKKALINAGSDDGVFEGLLFEIKYPSKIVAFGKEYDERFDMRMGKARVTQVYSKYSVVRIEESSRIVRVEDKVLVLT